MPEAKTCYYELLGVDRKCDVGEIKTRYRKLALQMHPDKAHATGFSVEEATKRFQAIQEAYSVLSDPQERAWYDSHREQILRGQDDGEPAEDPFKTKINLYKYFSSSCYNGFGSDSNGFFAVYAELFAAIDEEEADWEDLDSDEEQVARPPFGGADAEAADVASFYRNWLDFCSRKAFHHADLWNVKEAPNRQVRRAMEMENKGARKAAKKVFNQEVRQLVQFVKKRDPRVVAQQRQQMKDAAVQKQRDAHEKERRKKAEAVERQERLAASRMAEEARWAEVAAKKEERRARGEIVSEDESDESHDESEVEFVCEPCHKSFKSEKAFDQHAKSKKHLQVVAAFRRQCERELKEEAAREAAAKAAAGDEDGSDSESESHEEGEGAGGEDKEDEASSGEEEDEEEDSEEDAFLARFAARGGGRGGGRGRGGRGRGDGDDTGAGDFQPPARGGEGGSSSSTAQAGAAAADDGGAEDAEEASAADAAGEADGDDARRRSAADEAAAAAAEEGAGKRAQKKAKQRAILLERQAEKKEKERIEEERPSEAAETSGGREGGGQAQAVAEGARCAVCGTSFPSRSKLFQHIKATGHAALKTAEAPAEDARNKGRKKKR